MKTCTHHCSACGRHFHSLNAFNAHRTGAYPMKRLALIAVLATAALAPSSALAASNHRLNCGRVIGQTVQASPRTPTDWPVRNSCKLARGLAYHTATHESLNGDFQFDQVWWIGQINSVRQNPKTGRGVQVTEFQAEIGMPPYAVWITGQPSS